MEMEQISEMSLSQIRLDNFGRPLHIYFQHKNKKAENISINADGKHFFHYDDRSLVLPIDSNIGPAIIYEDRSSAWLANGYYHRWGGPAVTDVLHKYEQYWLNGIPISKEHHDECVEDDIIPIRCSGEYSLIYVMRSDNCIIHRPRGPAAFRADGSHDWFVNDELVEKNSESNMYSLGLGVAAMVAASFLYTHKQQEQAMQHVLKKSKY